MLGVIDVNIINDFSAFDIFLEVVSGFLGFLFAFIIARWQLKKDKENDAEREKQSREMYIAQISEVERKNREIIRSKETLFILENELNMYEKHQNLISEIQKDCKHFFKLMTESFRNYEDIMDSAVEKKEVDIEVYALSSLIDGKIKVFLNFAKNNDIFSIELLKSIDNLEKDFKGYGKLVSEFDYESAFEKYIEINEVLLNCTMVIDFQITEKIKSIDRK